MPDHGPKHKTKVEPKGKSKKRRGPASPGFKVPKGRGRKKTGTRNIA